MTEPSGEEKKETHCCTMQGCHCLKILLVLLVFLAGGILGYLCGKRCGMGMGWGCRHKMADCPMMAAPAPQETPEAPKKK